MAAFEVALRAAVFRQTNELLGWVLQQAVDGLDMAYQARPGEVFKGRIKRQVDGLFGSVSICRDYYHAPAHRSGIAPADAALGWELGCTPGLARMICRAGSRETSYQEAEASLEEIGGRAVSARQIQRMVQHIGPEVAVWQKRPARREATTAKVLYVSADGTGIPMRRAELEGVAGRQPDGSAKTRQVYLGCVFTQHRVDEKGSPVRDWDSTTYVSTLGAVDAFGPLLRQEAIRRGLGATAETVYIVDGAVGLAALGAANFPTATQIVDFFHGMEHAGRVVEALLGSRDHPDFKPRHRRWKRRLLRNGVKSLITDAQVEAARLGCDEAVNKALHYFTENVDRMQYRTFRKKGFFIGSGVVEAGCKTVIGKRCKQSGMHWSRPGASNILDLRCLQHSRRLDAFWEHRRHQLASRADTLPLTPSGGG